MFVARVHAHTHTDLSLEPSSFHEPDFKHRFLTSLLGTDFRKLPMSTLRSGGVRGAQGSAVSHSQEEEREAVRGNASPPE